MGLHRAGFDVTGIDIKPQKHYPFRFIQGDALRPPVRLEDFDLVWASPPCQAFTVARSIHRREHPNLIPATRSMLENIDALWVIENVPRAPIRPDLVLCGSQFGERRLRRHRWFETSWRAFSMLPPCNHGRETISVFGHGGHIYHGLNNWREVMDMAWAGRDGLAQAIPPYYSEHIGNLAIMAIEQRKTADEAPPRAGS